MTTPNRGRCAIERLVQRGKLHTRMIENLTDLPPGTLGFRASGKISSEEYRKMIEPIYAALERGEKLNVYFELADDFHGLDSGALSQDVKAAGWFGWLAPGELRLFEPSERDEARAWMAETPSG